MLYKVKSNSFLLIETLMGLMLIALAFPYIFPQQSALTRLDQKLQRERALHKKVSEQLIEKRATLSYDEISGFFNKSKAPIQLESLKFNVLNHIYTGTYTLILEEEKPDALLVKLNMVFTSKNESHSFSQNICLKKS